MAGCGRGWINYLSGPRLRRRSWTFDGRAERLLRAGARPICRSNQNVGDRGYRRIGLRSTTSSAGKRRPDDEV